MVESRFCMNIAQATISDTTNWRDRGCIIQAVRCWS
jgi:hypothetical protein